MGAAHVLVGSVLLSYIVIIILIVSGGSAEPTETTDIFGGSGTTGVERMRRSRGRGEGSGGGGCFGSGCARVVQAAREWATRRQMEAREAATLRREHKEREKFRKSELARLLAQHDREKKARARGYMNNFD